MVTQQFEHVDPPLRTKYTEAADYMRDNPGVWIKITSFPKRQSAGNLAHLIRHGQHEAFQPGTFDASSRGCDVIACYKGDVL